MAKPKMEKKKTVTFRVSSALHRALRIRAAETCRTIEALNTEALERYLGIVVQR